MKGSLRRAPSVFGSDVDGGWGVRIVRDVDGAFAAGSGAPPRCTPVAAPARLGRATSRTVTPDTSRRSAWGCYPGVLAARARLVRDRPGSVGSTGQGATEVGCLPTTYGTAGAAGVPAAPLQGRREGADPGRDARSAPSAAGRSPGPCPTRLGDWSDHHTIRSADRSSHNHFARSAQIVSGSELLEPFADVDREALHVGEGCRDSR